MQAKKASVNRYALLDEIRGADLISMVLYHAMWDIIWIFGVRIEWYVTWPGSLWQQSICWVFILLSGFCLRLGHHPFRRGAVVFAAGALVTAVTLVFMPEDVVWFGVLTFLGSAMIFTGGLEPILRRVPSALGLAACFTAFVLTFRTSEGWWGLGPLHLALPGGLYVNYFTSYFGFMSADFYSTDYFPLLPWLFLFWCGFYLFDLVKLEPLHRSTCAPLGWLGRHSLLVYLLHQPVLYAGFSVLFSLRKG